MKNICGLLLIVFISHCTGKAQHGQMNQDDAFSKTAPEKFTTKFEKSSLGFIFTQVILNGKKEWFLLDTGAPGLILNSSYFKASEETSGQVAGASGHAQAQQVSVKSFNWNGIQRTDFNTMALELSHLEKRIGRKFKGLIGMRQVKDYELMIDYEKGELTLFKKNKSQYHQSIKPTLAIPFELQAHIPVIKIKIGNHTYDFGIDTGAAFNLIDASAFDQISAQAYQFDKNVPLHGADKNVPQVKQITMKDTKVAGQSFKKMTYLVNSIAHLNASPAINIGGLLGVPFLSYKQKVSISFTDHKIYFWK
ncbi:hypothetical protein BKI52_11505 [marine bacterium AO1-C]|nr:hypothetical protein BKI52_11505 [marine bacterium AO1-C]